MKMRKKVDEPAMDQELESFERDSKHRANSKESNYPTSITALLGKEVYFIWFAAFVTRFLWYASPGEVIFDEVHFGKFTNAYITGKHYFDIHPPLGKLLLFLGASFFGYNDKHPLCAYEHIGGNLHNCGYELLRIFPVLFGTFIPPLMYICARVLGCTRLAAVFSALLVLFDNAFVVESRNVRMEPFIFTFVLLTCIFSFALANMVQTQYERQQQQLKQQQQSLVEEDPETAGLAQQSNAATQVANAEAAAQYERKKRRLYILTGIFLGCILSVKWTPGAALCLCLAIQHYIMPIVRNQMSAAIIHSTSPAAHISQRKPYSSSGIGTYTKHFAAHFRTCFMYLFLIPVSIYLLCFYIHFALLPYAGDGDGFMDERFQSQLIGNQHYNQELAARRPILYNPLFFLEYVIKLNKEMFLANFRTGGHQYDARWWSWPFMLRGVFYWNKGDQGGQRMIYLLGNAPIWWLSTFSLAIFVVMMLCRYTRISSRFAHVPLVRTINAKDRSAIFFRASSVFMFFFVQWLPYIMVSRSTFLYHYLPALIFAYLLCGLQFDFWTSKSTPAKRLAIVVVLNLAFFCSFLYFAPLSYGLLSKDESRFWIKSWR